MNRAELVPLAPELAMGVSIDLAALEGAIADGGANPMIVLRRLEGRCYAAGYNTGYAHGLADSGDGVRREVDAARAKATESVAARVLRVVDGWVTPAGVERIQGIANAQGQSAVAGALADEVYEAIHQKKREGDRG